MRFRGFFLGPFRAPRWRERHAALVLVRPIANSRPHEHDPARKGVFRIDASKGFIKDGNKNRLREQDIHRIVDAFTKQLEVPRYARMVPFDAIADAKNDFNLNLPRYIDLTTPENLLDIDGHLRGGLSAA